MLGSAYLTPLSIHRMVKEGGRGEERGYYGFQFEVVKEPGMKICRIIRDRGVL